MKKYILSLLTITLVVLACNKSNNSDESSLIDAFHENYYDVNIEVAIQNFKTAIDTQVSLTTNFNENPTQENFDALKTQWLTSAKSFSKLSVYNVVEVKATFLDILIYNYDISTDRIEANIAAQTTYDSAYFSTKSTIEKGLGAIEYLLYNNQDSAVAYSLLTEDSFRLDYLVGVMNNVLEKKDALINFWSGYKDTFSNATDTSCTDNARCLAFNQLINVIDVIRVTKLGKPSGLENSSGADLEGLEAFRSGNSLELIRSSLEEIEYVYANSTINFADIVNDIADNTEVSNAIATSFTNTYTIIDTIDTSLYTAISNEDPNVELLYESLFTLVQYFSVDAASVLSVTILPTDNDGD